jgi:hypothetical protein
MIPLCPDHNVPLEVQVITQGDLLLGYLFVCPFDEWGSRKSEGLDCKYLLDGDADGNPIIEAFRQLEFPT